jgi:predicted dehydrogenase
MDLKMDKVKVGIIGTGRISGLHAAEYINNDQAEIVAVCDNNLDLAKTCGKEWGVNEQFIFQDYKDLLAVNDVNLVEILVPHHLHFQITSDAFQSGKHVSLQKPMAVSVEEADRMIEAAKQSGKVFKVFENFIFYPPVMKAKALIDAGEIGDLLTIRIKSNAGYSPNAWNIPDQTQAWRFDEKACGGGPLVFDDGHHKFSLAWYFMGIAEEVHAWIDQTEISPGAFVDSPAIVSWKFPNHRYGNLEVVYSKDLLIDTNHYAQDDRIEITGTKGVIWINRGHGNMTDQPPVSLYSNGKTTHFSHMKVGWEESFILSTRHFINALLNNQTPSLTGEEGREILRFTLAAQESAKLGKSIKL